LTFHIGSIPQINPELEFTTNYAFPQTNPESRSLVTAFLGASPMSRLACGIPLAAQRAHNCAVALSYRLSWMLGQVIHHVRHLAADA
jgi:hypothetical protein